MYDESKKQLNQNLEGWYETDLFWKEKHPLLDANKSGSLGRLNSLLHNLKHKNEYNVYNNIENGIVEKVDEKS